MAKLTLDDALSGYRSTSTYNANNALIETELNDKVLYRDNPAGEANQMESLIDMNSNRIINLPSPNSGSEPARWQDVRDGVIGVAEALPSLSGNDGKVISTDGVGLVFRGTPFITSNYAALDASLAAGDYAAGDSVVLADTTTPQHNGVWIIVAIGSYVANVGTIRTGGSFAALRQYSGDWNTFWFLSAAEIADVLAYTYGVDVTTAVQNAMDTSHAANHNLYSPAGGYRVTGLVQPGQSIAPNDDRTRSWRWYGQGTGEALALSAPVGSTIFDSVTDAPVFQDQLSLATASNGTSFIEQIRFHGTTTADPIVKFQSLFGICEVRNVIVYQRGTGDGVSIGRGSLYEFFMCWAFNSDWLPSTVGLGASRTGVAWKIATTSDAALSTLTKCNARGFKTGYIQAGVGGARSISNRIKECQCSVIYEGVRIEDGASTTVDNLYCEVGDGGTGIYDAGTYTKIINSQVGAGYSIGIDVSDTAVAKGTVVENNVVSIGSYVNGVGIHVASSANFGGYNKTVRGNYVQYTLGTAGVTGILIEGLDPRMSVLDNCFDTKSAWTGAGTVKIDDQSTSGIYGMMQGIYDKYEFPVLSRGAISFFDSVVLTGSDIATNVMTLPDSVSYFKCTPVGAEVVSSFEAGNVGTRLVMIRTTNTNLTINDGARVVLDGGVAFTGAGMITFLMERVGGLTYAYEQSRVAH